MTITEQFTLEQITVDGNDCNDLRAILDYLRTLTGMSLCANLEDQIHYLQDPNLTVYAVREVGNTSVVAIAAVKKHRRYEYETWPFRVNNPNMGVVLDVAELCCLAVLPDYQKKRLCSLLTKRRLEDFAGKHDIIIELRPDASSINRMSEQPRPHASTRSVQNMAIRHGFDMVGRARADNSVVLFCPKAQPE